MGTTVEAFLARLARQNRMLLLGGLAIIAHGMSRATQDVDVWLEPSDSAQAWATRLLAILDEQPEVRAYDLRQKRPIPPQDITAVIDRDGVIRLLGLDRPLDLFRIPHNLEPHDFEATWERAAALENTPIRLPDEIDLLLTKESTPRAQDAADVAFLEAKIRARLTTHLASCSLDEAKQSFDRFADHETCRAALRNPNADVRNLATGILRQFADAGDPFAADLLRSESSAPQ